MPGGFPSPSQLETSDHLTCRAEPGRRSRHVASYLLLWLFKPDIRVLIPWSPDMPHILSCEEVGIPERRYKLIRMSRSERESGIKWDYSPRDWRGSLCGNGETLCSSDERMEDPRLLSGIRSMLFLRVLGYDQPSRQGLYFRKGEWDWGEGG